MDHPPNTFLIVLCIHSFDKHIAGDHLINEPSASFVIFVSVTFLIHRILSQLRRKRQAAVGKSRNVNITSGINISRHSTIFPKCYSVLTKALVLQHF